MTPEEAFLQAILEDPLSDTPRLIFADWLEENGQAVRAEFVRVQCELDRWEQKPDKEELQRQDPARSVLFHRERELWETRGDNDDWCVPDVNRHFQRFCHMLIPQNAMADITSASMLPGVTAVIFRRGFADEFRGTTQLFATTAEAIFRECPITRVRLLDCSPVNFSHPGRDYWMPGTLMAMCLPAALSVSWNVSYDSEEAARDAMSTFLIKYGRHLAGLPALPGRCHSFTFPYVPNPKPLASAGT